MVHDWLKTVTLSGIADKILLGGPKHYALRNHELFMPLEYSVAGFRFGHSLVRGAYDRNRNFGKEANVIPIASFDLLFLFTGNGFARNPADPTKSIRNPFGGQPTLPFNWIIEWDRFTDKGSADPTHFARKLDTRGPTGSSSSTRTSGSPEPLHDRAQDIEPDPACDGPLDPADVGLQPR